MKPFLNGSFQNCKLFCNRFNHCREIVTRTWPKMNTFRICCRPEVAGDVISGGNVKTIKGDAGLNFEADSLSRFRDIPNKCFVTAEADIDDSTKRKGICVWLKNCLHAQWSMQLLRRPAMATVIEIF